MFYSQPLSASQGQRAGNDIWADQNLEHENMLTVKAGSTISSFPALPFN